MTENDIATEIIGSCIDVHRKLGPGLLESVYETVLAYELTKKRLNVKRQCGISFSYDGLVFDDGFRADLIVEDSVIVELKSVEKISAVHKKQLLTYLRLANMKLGLLVNFNDILLKNGITRIVNDL